MQTFRFLPNSNQMAKCTICGDREKLNCSKCYWTFCSSNYCFTGMDKSFQEVLRIMNIFQTPRPSKDELFVYTCDSVTQSHYYQKQEVHLQSTPNQTNESHTQGKTRVGSLLTQRRWTSNH